MLLNYLKVSWRFLTRNKAYAFINITGLGIGFSVALMLLIYVWHQLSYDRFHEHGDRIYRITIEGTMADGQVMSSAVAMGQIAELVMEQIPEIEMAMRARTQSNQEVYVAEKRFAGEVVLFADSVFFQMFSFPLTAGNPKEVLNKPFTVVLSEEVAYRFFGTTDVLDEMITINSLDYRISGIMKNIPANSHLQAGIIASFTSMIRPGFNWIERDGVSFPTYILVREDSCHEEFTEKTLALADEYTNDLFRPMGFSIVHGVQPLSRIYLHSRFSMAMEETGDIRNVYVFSLLTLFIILIAVFNFVNLMTAQSEKRAREIGLRKVIGAGKPDLIRQFIGESVLISLLALALALVLNEILIGPFSSMLGEQFDLIYRQQPLAFLGIVGFVIIIGILAGIYPAFYLSHYQPAVVLKGGYQGHGGPNVFRKILAGLQFAISIFLIASLLLVQKQVSFMKHKELGFEREGVITLRNLTPRHHESYNVLASELKQHPGVVQVTASQSIPGQTRSVQNAYRRHQDPSTAIMIHENRIQPGYLETFGMRLIQGRDFDPEMQTDRDAIIINETAAKKLGLEDPVGEDIFVWRHEGRIIGVVADFNFRSLHHEIDPMAFTMYASSFHYISVRYRPGQIREVMDYAQQVLETADPNYVFDYLFADQLFEQMYRQEERINQMISTAAILAIIISFMGLYALTSFTVAGKVKEIGVRKTFGASTTSIVLALMGELSRWLVAGALIALPLSWLVVGNWLRNFAFRIELSEQWHLFVLAVVLAGMVGMFAMVYQSVLAAKANPIDSLRAE
ncbi:MAG: FtsX-like permease family protein [Bacteroidales bacterium]|nr:FtsX-like permease family protein [Bacteroidales bacterium]